MKTQIKVVLALLVCSAGLFANAQDARAFELLDRMLGGGAGGCGCETTACCSTSCGADRGCGADHGCGADRGCGCGLFGHKHSGGCGCEGAARYDSCSNFSTHAAKSRCCDSMGPDTCAAKSRCGGCGCHRPLLNLLSILKLPCKLFHCHSRGCGSCGCDSCDGGSCGCETTSHGCDSCGCHGNGHGMHKGEMVPLAKPVDDDLNIPVPPTSE